MNPAGGLRGDHEFNDICVLGMDDVIVVPGF